MKNQGHLIFLTVSLWPKKKKNGSSYNLFLIENLKVNTLQMSFVFMGVGGVRRRWDHRWPSHGLQPAAV